MAIVPIAREAGRRELRVAGAQSSSEEKSYDAAHTNLLALIVACGYTTLV